MLWPNSFAHAATLRFGLTGDYPPFAEYLPDGSLVGADVELAKRFAHSIGAEPVFVRTSWSNLASDFGGGRFDIALGGLTITPERARLGRFSMVLLQDGKRPLARCEEAARYQTLRQIDRSGVRVQINRGPLIGTLAKQWFGHAQVLINPDDADLAQAVIDGRADVWITDGIVVDQVAARHSGVLCATTATPFTTVAKAWLIRSDAPLLRRVNRFLKRSLPQWRAAITAFADRTN